MIIHRRTFLGSAGALLAADRTAPCASRIAFNTHGYNAPSRRSGRRFTLAETCDSLARIGYKGVEIIVYPKGNDIDYDDPKQLSELQRLLKSAGLELACLSPSSHFEDAIQGGNSEKDVAAVRKQIDIAQRLRAPVMRIGCAASAPAFAMPLAQAVERLAGPIRKCVAYARQRGVKLGIETHGNNWAVVPRNIKALLDVVDDPYLGIILHTFPRNAERTVDLVGRRVLHTHLADAAGYSMQKSHIQNLRKSLPDEKIMEALDLTRKQFDAALAWEPAPESPKFMGGGDVDFKAVLAGLKKSGYKGWWNGEGHLFDAPEEEAQKGFDYLKRALCAT